MKTAIVSASRDKNYSKSLLAASLKPIEKYVTHTKQHELHSYNFPDNTAGLSVTYNTFLDQHPEYECVIFAHDDIFIDDLLLLDKLDAAFNDYDIIGLAGGSSPVLAPPILWHLMCPRNTHAGCVAHFANEQATQIFHTAFGPTPARVALIDGLFMAVKVPLINKVGWRFNPEFTYHHYDIAGCIDANNKKLKIGVIPINVIHASPGLRSLQDPKFQASQNAFMRLYA